MAPLARGAGTRRRARNVSRFFAGGAVARGLGSGLFALAGPGKPGTRLCGEARALLPRVQETIARLQARHALGEAVYPVGYSLGGLAALYFHCEAGFSGCGSCSGSLWYPGWLEYLEARAPGGKIYLSLGGKEKNARDPLMRTVEEATCQTKALLSASARCTFVHEPGGHFRDVPQRLARAIAWLLGA